MGPRILKSLAGTETRLMMTVLSHSINSDWPRRSIRIQRREPTAFFLAVALLVVATASIAGGGGGSAGRADFFFRRNVNLPISSPALSLSLFSLSRSRVYGEFPLPILRFLPYKSREPACITPFPTQLGIIRRNQIPIL